MSILHVNQIKKFISDQFENKIDMSDMGGPGPNFDNKFLSRALAGYAVVMLTSSSPIDVAPYITDGGDDNGIDCIYYENSDKTLYLIQSKWINDGSGEPEFGDVTKFAEGIRDLVNFKFDRFNAKINTMRQMIIQKLEDPHTKYHIILIYTGINGPAIHSERCLRDLEEEMNDASDILKVSVIKQDKIHASLTQAFMDDPINIDVGIKYWGKVDTPNKAFYGQINGSTLTELWKIYGDRLFAKNLRSVLGDTDVNEEIRLTINESPELFWYYNNGITIVSDKIVKTMAGGGDNSVGTFHCTNINIVNGAQTVSTIGKSGLIEPEKVKFVNVNCKIIELENGSEHFKSDITRTNNRQNKIENRDFVALDPEQHRIRNEAAIEGYTYNILRSDNLVRSEKSFDLVESTTALSCIAMKPQLFVQLKREIGKLWEDLSKAPYKELFNPSISTLFVIRAIILQREIDNQLSKIYTSDEVTGKMTAIIIHGNRMIASLIYTRLPCNQLSAPSINFEEIKGLISTELVKTIIDKVTHIIEEFYSNAIIPTLFKNLSKCKFIYEEAKKQL